MAVGLPSIAFENVSGVSDLVTDKVNGLLLRGETDDAYEFSQSIELIFNDPELREKYGCKSLDMIQRYAKDNLLKIWTGLLKDIA